MRSIILTAFLAAAATPPQASATIQKPKAQTVTGGLCRILSDGAFAVQIGPNPNMRTLALAIGPSVMTEQLHANTAKYAGPGKYANEIIAVYLGKTALEDSYLGLGTVTINADGKSGAFALNDGTASGTFDCGAALLKP